MQYAEVKLGIDISKASFDGYLMNEGQGKHKVFSNDENGFEVLRGWLNKLGIAQAHACMEATGRYGEALAEYLVYHGHQVSIVNAYLIKQYREGHLHLNKTDRGDAELIAAYCLKEEATMRLWAPMDEKQKHLRALVRRQDELKEERTREENRLESIIDDAFVGQNIKAHIDYLTAQIKLIQGEIDRFIEQDPDLRSKQKLLKSIPGVGQQSAQRFMAEIADTSQYEDSGQIVAHFGLNPRIFQSGTSVRKQSRISKQGQKQMRASLYMPAVVATRYNPVIMDLSQRMTKTGHVKMEIIVAAMRKLLTLMYGVLKSGQPFDPDYGKKFNFAP
jgi:transposase